MIRVLTHSFPSFGGPTVFYCLILVHCYYPLILSYKEHVDYIRFVTQNVYIRQWIKALITSRKEKRKKGYLHLRLGVSAVQLTSLCVSDVHRSGQVQYGLLNKGTLSTQRDLNVYDK